MSRPAWGQPPAATTPATSFYNPQMPAVNPMEPPPMMTPSSYSHGIHNPAVESLNTFSPPVPHYEPGKKGMMQHGQKYTILP